MNEPKRLYLDTEVVHPAGRRKVSICRTSDTDIEYIRNDVFIEQAAEWLMENVEKHISADGEYTVYYNEMVEDFKKAMKGE